MRFATQVTPPPADKKGADAGGPNTPATGADRKGADAGTPDAPGSGPDHKPEPS